MSFLFPGFIHQSTPFGPVFTTFFKILFRIRRVIQVRNSHCAMGHCCEPKFFADTRDLKLGWCRPSLVLLIYALFSITAPLKDMASF
jgi:hypothetical protein